VVTKPNFDLSTITTLAGLKELLRRTLDIDNYKQELVTTYFHILPLWWRNFILYFDRVIFKLLKRAPSSPPTAPISMKMIR
jgi:hypothetical protein